MEVQIKRQSRWEKFRESLRVAREIDAEIREAEAAAQRDSKLMEDDMEKRGIGTKEAPKSIPNEIRKNIKRNTAGGFSAKKSVETSSRDTSEIWRDERLWE